MTSKGNGATPGSISRDAISRESITGGSGYPQHGSQHPGSQHHGSHDASSGDAAPAAPLHTRTDSRADTPGPFSPDIGEPLLSSVPRSFAASEAAAASAGSRIIGASGAISVVRDVATSIAPRRSTVMLLGETGTGKEMLARHIHMHSERAN